MIDTASHRTLAELDAGVVHFRVNPADHRTVELVLRRPALGEREVVDRAESRVGLGVIRDNLERGSTAVLTDRCPMGERSGPAATPWRHGELELR